MKISFLLLRACAVAVALALGACGHVEVTHVPPGGSLGVALSRKADLVRMPVTAQPAATVVNRAPNLEPDLPKMDNTARAADAFSRGEFCMNAGKDEEAIVAFQEAVKIEPNFTEAWQRLAALYEKKGDNKKAIDAFRKSKSVAVQ
jgi:Tfp pilus assembly protein PilF